MNAPLSATNSLVLFKVVPKGRFEGNRVKDHNGLARSVPRIHQSRVEVRADYPVFKPLIGKNGGKSCQRAPMLRASLVNLVQCRH